ncbi:hypothetical protein GX51_00681 [Blastomyces parvus]|uniref:Uncharacterized protein n=1 Tax=Blastomyces parvus TaxID=2060905 RepID=A0A2B7XKV1_9EURO|nr:hypothetical protein GX51_00681 [Blastomyces parvus]
MAWGTFPTAENTSWGPPNGGIPPHILPPPPPAGYVVTQGADGKLSYEPRWASVSTTAYQFDKVSGNPTNPVFAFPGGPTPAGQGQAQTPHFFLPQQEIASLFPPMPPPAATASAPASAAAAASAPNRPAQPRSAPAGAPARAPGPSQAQAPAAGPTAPTSASGGAFAGMPPPPQVYAVPGMPMFGLVDPQGNLQVTLPGQHSAANLPPGFLQNLRPS